ncbi:MAG: hypothetical protein M3494_12435 [Actinomycetota bacterium]|jgi:hypothetical protein|nr:hypothetical protein [Rubrobacter sp.]MDQ3508804.1 hypothetical protein [Actinomycetota bacterium]
MIVFKVVMAIEKRRDEEEPEGRRSYGGDAEFWSSLGLDIEKMNPRAQAVTGIVTGGAILLGTAALILFTNFWWLIFVFGWFLFPALGAFARGVAGLVDSPKEEKRLPESDKERELLEAMREKGELTPAQAAMETSLSVKEADGMLKELAEGGHLDVRVRGGGLFYALWDHDRGGFDRGSEG